MATIHAFVVSWPGWHEKAILIADRIRGVADKVSIVYSDPDPERRLEVDCDLIRRPNELFWGDKFQACLSACAADLMLIIQADCECEDWHQLVSKCRAAMSANPWIGVWVPLVDWVKNGIRTTRLFGIPSLSLSLVAYTDAIVFAVAKPVMGRLKTANYEGNVYGWGIDALATSYAYSHDMAAVMDESVLVAHPKSRGYPEDVALAQCLEFLERELTVTEAVQNRLFWSYMSMQEAINAQAEASRKQENT